jgi:hypothetical protein
VVAGSLAAEQLDILVVLLVIVNVAHSSSWAFFDV